MYTETTGLFGSSCSRPTITAQSAAHSPQLTRLRHRAHAPDTCEPSGCLSIPGRTSGACTGRTAGQMGPCHCLPSLPVPRRHDALRLGCRAAVCGELSVNLGLAEDPAAFALVGTNLLHLFLQILLNSPAMPTFHGPSIELLLCQPSVDLALTLGHSAPTCVELCIFL